jgi:hydroxypyruvate isomerase
MAVVKGRIAQSIAYWGFHAFGEFWNAQKICQVAQQLGCKSVELIDPAEWGVLKQHGLLCALTPNGMSGPPFAKGFNNPAYHQELTARTRQAIDASAAAGFPNVIAFTGYRWRDAEDPTSEEISLEEGANHCVHGLQALAAYAASQRVTLCLEQLSTRDATHAMKGHPGYQGSDLDYVAAIVRRVDSPGLKLLFDAYHVQVMHGDLLRRLEENQDILGHVHLAGCPGRGEIGDGQEINYRRVMQRLLEIGYQGYVGHEFIPAGDPLAGLTEAVKLCSV